jgi:serine-type D-Ala-D-Ala carboxypeptidase/endopeptidase (penicillin-binding protein 4)
VLESLISFLSLWFGQPKVQTLQSTNLAHWLEAAVVQVEAVQAGSVQVGAVQAGAVDAPDPLAVAIVRQNLGKLATAGMPVTRQGIWVQIDNQVVAENQGTTPLSAASLTKIATTLAVLSTWGPDRQLITVVGATGPIQNRVLQGDLVVQASGDPLFVWEEAIALANALHQAGIDRVAGNLVISGDFAMNFQVDPQRAGILLKQGMDASLWNAEAATQYAALPAGTARPDLAIAGSVEVIPLSQTMNRVITPLVRHRSLPMSQILKVMNSYSNNVMAEMLAKAVGGANAVAQKASEVAQVPIAEIQLINGSGLGEANRISPRAVSAMMIALQHDLQPLQLNVADVLPVIGRDRGTLSRRRLPIGAAVKSGTLDRVSALAGVMPTRDRGLVWFTIINEGTADLTSLHNQQDLLVQQLEQQWGSALSIPAAILPGDRDKQPSNQLGAANRNQVL